MTRVFEEKYCYVIVKCPFFFVVIFKNLIFLFHRFSLQYIFLKDIMRVFVLQKI